MKTATLQEQLAEAEATIRALQDELAETNRGLVALSMELEQRVEARTAELAQSNEALRAEIAERNRVEVELESPGPASSDRTWMQPVWVGGTTTRLRGSHRGMTATRKSSV